MSKIFDKLEVFGTGSSASSTALTISNSANAVSFLVKDDGEVVAKKMTIGLGTNSELFLDNNNTGKQLSLNSTTGSFNTITVTLGTTGDLSRLNTNGGAWGMNQSLRFDTAGVSQIYVNNGGNGLRLVGSNGSNSDLFIKGTADSTLGNVGINTSSPNAKLQVRASTSGDILAINPSGGSGGVYVSSSAANNPLIFAQNSGGTTVYGFQTEGNSYFLNNLSIGINSNSVRLRVLADGNSDFVSFMSSGNTGGIYFSNTPGNNPFLYGQSKDFTTELRLSTSGNSYINGSGGNLGIGTVSPQDKLHISNGTLRINDVGATYGAGKVAVSDANGSISFSSITSLTSSKYDKTGGTISGDVIVTGTTRLESLTAVTICVSGSTYGTVISGVANSIQSLDSSISNFWDYILSANTTFTFSNTNNGQVNTVSVRQDSTGGYSVSWPGTVLWPNGVAPVQTPTSGKTDIYTFIQINSSIYGSVVQNF